MKLLVDMNLSPRWIDLLHSRGMEALHWSTVGPANAPDQQIMAYAAANDMVVLTHDLDFSSILAVTNGDKPSVVQIRTDDVRVDRIGEQVLSALRQAQKELLEGALVTIDLNRVRLRLLPLRPNPRLQ